LNRELVAREESLEAISGSKAEAEEREKSLTEEVRSLKQQLETLALEKSSTVEQSGAELREARAKIEVLEQEHAELSRQKIALEAELATRKASPSAVAAELPKADAPKAKNGTEKEAPNEPARPVNPVLSAAPRLTSWLLRGNRGRNQTAEPTEKNGADSTAHYDSAEPSSRPVVAAPNGDDQAAQWSSEANTAVAVEDEAAAEEVTPGPKFAYETVRRVLNDAPRAVMTMRNSLQYFIRHPRDLKLLDQLLAHVQTLSKAAASIAEHPVHRLCSNIEKLISELIDLPELINKSTLRTLGQSLDFLAIILEEKNLSRMNSLPVPKVLNVDDEDEMLKQVSASLHAAQLPTRSANSAVQALVTMQNNRFDLITLDVNMPGMNGLEMCAKVRSLKHYQRVPIIFLTAAATAQNRAQSLLLGGNDLIAKPFVHAELSVKALMWIYKGQLNLL
jgi:CheY-like chemotaxis protein